MQVFTHRGATFRVFQDSKQGGRLYMEDVVCLNCYKTETGEHDFIYLAIFDGHGGSQAAEFAKNHLLDELKSTKGFWTQDREQISKAIKEAFLATHKLMWKDVVSWPKTVSGLPSTAGTTASIVLIKGGYMYIAHVGDSSIVLAEKRPWSNLHANCVTVDHKPDSPAELKRIEESGGQVKVKAGVPRVVWHRPKPPHKGPVRRSTHMVDIPFLAVARALGDLWSYNSEQNTFVVSPEPDISVYKIDCKKHKYIIIASDGLWNMVKPQEAVGYVEELATQKFDALNSNPAKKLVQLALNKWAYKNLRADNTSVFVVTVDQQSPDDNNMSSTKSDDSCANTAKLMDAEVFTDLDVNVRANIQLNSTKINAQRSRLSHSKLLHHKHLGVRHPKIVNHVLPPATTDNAQVCHLHNNHSRKHKDHLFWDESPPVTSCDKIIIPTKYKHAECTINEKFAVSDSSQSQSADEPASCINSADEKMSCDICDTPAKISVAVPLEEELPELNKVIVPSKYKMTSVECKVNTVLTPLRNQPVSEGVSNEFGCDIPSKRKAVDGGNAVVIKKSKKWLSDAQNTEPSSSGDGLESCNCIDDSIQVVVTTRSPLKMDTYHEQSPSPAIISPIWPNSLDPSTGNELCSSAHTVSGRKDHHLLASGQHVSISAVHRDGVHHSSRKLLVAKSQEGRAKRSYFRAKLMKLGNLRHRTRFQVRTRFTRKY